MPLPRIHPISSLPVLLTVLASVMLSGCQRGELHTGFTVKSPAYYRDNPGEARVTTEHCKLFLARHYSNMKYDEQQAWQESTDGRNCKTAREALSSALMKERARQARELS